ncbi:DNA protection during starvation protein [Mycobacteroides abscessus subsp. abscessus]|nr:DNA protection during starvation protein [Mycobacteroides abscessus subsp. abscessus]SLE93998.1 DNA protection during starvation protein [Mycobacteroides abscessus subsp. abscessus]SLF51302.1 DNA protection during starvation protein [Mycobacteroides abscessus subsp. abscessus]SLG56971.1 DNA protection during starvation protein [Mycobacteroides abscessus subsp. abscessus]
MTEFTIPGLTDTQSRKIADLLQSQLSTYNDLHLTLKHVHWNVVGPNFIGVHEMLDPQVELVRGGCGRGGRTHRRTRKVSAGHAWGDSQGPHMGRLLGGP